MKNFIKKALDYIYNIVYYRVFMLIFAFLGATYLKFVLFTSKVVYTGNVKREYFLNNNIILAFWHGRIIAPFVCKNLFSKPYALVSASDSAIFTRTVANLFGVSIVKGSANMGGTQAIRDILKLFKYSKQKVALAVSPDGSIGPRMRAKDGIAYMSSMTKVPVVPISISAKRVIISKRWDSFMLPLPFNRISIIFGDIIEPYNNNIKINITELTLKIENSINKVMWELDEQYSIKRILPSDTDKKGVVTNYNTNIE